jgi:hypothetical protein
VSNASATASSKLGLAIVAASWNQKGQAGQRPHLFSGLEVFMKTSRRFTQHEAIATSFRLNMQIRRRQFFELLGFATALAIPAACHQARAERAVGEPKVGYRSDSPEVQIFYRVNRYPRR